MTWHEGTPRPTFVHMMHWFPWLLWCCILPTHDFHYSRSDWQWNEETRAYEVTVRVFTDDWESALAGQAGKAAGGPIRLGDDREHPRVAEWARGYLNNNIHLTSGSKAIPLVYIGMEVEHDVTYLFLESYPIQPKESIEIEQTMFFELFDDQVNEVHLKSPLGAFQESLHAGLPKWRPRP